MDKPRKPELQVKTMNRDGINNVLQRIVGANLTPEINPERNNDAESAPKMLNPTPSVVETVVNRGGNDERKSGSNIVQRATQRRRKAVYRVKARGGNKA